MYLQVHLFGVMFHSGPVRLGEEWGGPPEIEIILTGVNLISVLEIRAEGALLQPRRGNLLSAVWDKSNYKPYWGLIAPQ